MKETKILIVALAIIGVATGVYFILSSKTQQNQKVTFNEPKEPVSPTPGSSTESAHFKIDSDFSAYVFASGLGDARVLTFTPGGTLLVSAPQRGSVFALPDKNKDGLADEVKRVIAGETGVHGMAFYNGKLYVASITKVTLYSWDETSLNVKKEKELFSLPQNANHNRRSIVFNNSGQMFISVGSTCNVCSEDPMRGGSVWQSDASGASPRVFATGLRNTAFLAVNPKSGEIWATEMGRDFLGDDLPPDEINIVRQNQDYGWPYCYGNRVHDNNFDPNNSHQCNTTAYPIYEIPAHSAPLGLTFINSSQFPDAWQGDLLVAYHGSWNRSVPAGYKVVRLAVDGNTITGSEDFITDLAPYGRPVDLVFDSSGNLYLSDDKGGNVYIIRSKSN